MFDRKKYKQFALTQLKDRWRISVLITLFATVILSIFQIPTIFNGIINLDWANLSALGMEAINNAIDGVYTPARTGFTFLEMLVEFIFEMALVTVFIKMSKAPEHAPEDKPGFESPIRFGDFVEGFSYWLKAILVGLWQSLWIFLWSLLLFFPGLVKYYAYSQMYFLACEYPNVSVPKLMQISKEITKGHKWDLFALDLSFLGWYVLSALFTLGIGNLWITPYHTMTKVNAYHALVKEAIAKGILTAEDVQ